MKGRVADSREAAFGQSWSPEFDDMLRPMPLSLDRELLIFVKSDDGRVIGAIEGLPVSSQNHSCIECYPKINARPPALSYGRNGSGSLGSMQEGRRI